MECQSPTNGNDNITQDDENLEERTFSYNKKRKEPQKSWTPQICYTQLWAIHEIKYSFA